MRKALNVVINLKLEGSNVNSSQIDWQLKISSTPQAIER